MTSKSILFLFSFLIYLTGAGQTWISFTDSSVSFTALYPVNWTYKMKEQKRVFFTSPADDEKDSFRENININVTSNPEYGTGIKIEDVLPVVKESLKTRIKNLQIISDRIFTFNNAQSAELKYSGVSDINGAPLEISFLQWFCFWKQRLYTITYTSVKGNTRHDADALKIIESIRFRY